MNTIKLHHQAPQAYLRRFANSSQRVNVYDRITQDFLFSQKTKGVAAENGFYTIIGDDGQPSDLFERSVLGRIDSDISRLLPKMGQPLPTLTTKERVHIDVFMTVQFLRTREGKRFIIDKIDYMLRSEVEQYLIGASDNQIRSYLAKRFPEHHQEDVDLFRKISQNLDQPVEITTLQWLQVITDNVSKISEALVTRWWVFLDSPNDPFLTSDTPVVMMGSGPHGLGTAEKIIWPISPHRVLVRPLTGVGDRRVPVVEIAPADVVQSINQSVADQSGRHIIWHPEFDPTPNITLPSGPNTWNDMGVAVRSGEWTYDKIKRENKRRQEYELAIRKALRRA